jgi:hypothetical protein
MIQERQNMASRKVQQQQAGPWPYQTYKRRFPAQEMLVLRAQLAYNLIAWAHLALARTEPQLASFGLLRFVRDLFHIPGRIELDAQGHVFQIT